MKIHFQDNGQDFLWWRLQRIDKSTFEVVGCGPFQSWVWTGKKIAANSLKQGRYPVLVDTGRALVHRIQKVEVAQ